MANNVGRGEMFLSHNNNGPDYVQKMNLNSASE